MKTRTRILIAALSLLMACTLLASAWITPALAVAPAEKLSDEQSRITSEITLADGTKTGVLWSDISVSGSVYGADRQVNMVEVDLSNTHLSMEVINNGAYMVKSKTMDKGAADYNAAHEGQTVLAAINGDLFMNAVHSGSGVTKKTLSVVRGVLIIDGEIWASQQIDQENLGATNDEKGLPAGNKAAFGVTSRNQPLVGSPDIAVSMTVNGKTLKADGINRLPALNALVVYNHRVNDTNYALNDAYEVELKVDDSSAFKAGGEISAKVVAIYKSGAATRPSIGEKTILLTARGNRVSDLQNNFKVGDTVTFKTTMTDRMGRTELWQDVQDAIGGHMQPIVDGKLAVANGMKVLYCIGEKDTELDRWDEVLREQLEIGLEGVDKSQVVIGYEPIWSIGPGKTPAGKEYITKIARFVKEVTGGIDVVYGGGLKVDNAEMLASIEEIDGGLIALTRFQGEIGFYPDEYIEIIRTYLGK